MNQAKTISSLADGWEQLDKIQKMSDATMAKMRTLGEQETSADRQSQFKALTDLLYIYKCMKKDIQNQMAKIASHNFNQKKARV